MKLREREMPMDPEVERELEAIDRALGGEPVDPDLEVLAELARALREERVGAEPGFAADLDQRVADGFPGPAPRPPARGAAQEADRRAAAPHPGPGRSRGHACWWSPAWRSARAARSGVAATGASARGRRRTSPWGCRRTSPPAGGGAGRRCGRARASRREHAAPRASRHRAASGTHRVDTRNISRAASAADVPPAKRKVARRVDLALSTSPERFRTAADGVLDVVRDHRGYVLRSNVSGGDPDTPRSQLGHASFTLRIPAGELSAALGDLSDLGHVVSRTDGRVDITSRFVSAQKRIAALEETRQNLLRQLAEAVTLTEQESIRRRLEIVQAQLSAAEEDLGAAQRRVQLVPVSVTIDADRALAGGGDAGGLEPRRRRRRRRQGPLGDRGRAAGQRRGARPAGDPGGADLAGHPSPGAPAARASARPDLEQRPSRQAACACRVRGRRVRRT